MEKIIFFRLSFRVLIFLNFRAWESVVSQVWKRNTETGVNFIHGSLNLHCTIQGLKNPIVDSRA